MADNEPRFSFFYRPIGNLRPSRTMTLREAWLYIIGADAVNATRRLRSLNDKDERRSFKANNFDYVTFSGTFSKRSKAHLLQHSGLICIDFDHVDEVEVLFSRLLRDEYFETQLMFRSPSGDGIKWVIPIDTEKATHEDYFDGILWYCHETYGISPDRQCRDVGRACFLPYDPDAYLNDALKL